MKPSFFWIALLSSLFLSLASCTSAYKQSVGGDTDRTFTRIYVTDFNTAWQAALDALKNSRLEVSNREGGLVQTRWTDNTEDKNFADSIDGADAYQKARYRVKVTVAKGTYDGEESVKITVQREQLIQRDVLEGWRPQETDAIAENTLLYRIGRLITMRMRISAAEERKTKEQIEGAEF